MKKQSVFLVILAVALVFGLTLAGCKNEPEEVEKSIRITGVTGNGMPDSSAFDWARISIFSGTVQNPVHVAGQGGVQVTNQTLQTRLAVPVDGATHSDGPFWTGSGEHFIQLQFVKLPDRNVVATYVYSDGTALNSQDDTPKYNFTKAETVIEFSKFFKVP